MSSLEVILVRHAEPVAVGTPGVADDDRPLTEQGAAAAARLADDLVRPVPVAIYSSPYRRAMETVAPIAARIGLVIEPIDDLRERRLSLVPHAEWRESLARSWADPDFSLPGAESGRMALERMDRAMAGIRARHAAGGRVIAGSHGNLISLLLQRFDPRIGLGSHLAMPMPAVYCLRHDGQGWRLDEDDAWTSTVSETIA